MTAPAEAGGGETEPRVWSFFYGSFIDLEVLKLVDCVPGRSQVGRLPGYDLVIRPLANLVRSDERCVYGLLATTTHRELEQLYAYARKDLGGTYLPEAVLVEGTDGWRPALCYIAPALVERPASRDYVDRIAGPARALGFPDWYVARIESFRP